MGFIFVRPRIEVKAIEGDSLDTDGDRGNAGPHVAIKAVLVHAEIGGRIPQAQEARRHLFVVSPHVFRQRVVPVA